MTSPQVDCPRADNDIMSKVSATSGLEVLRYASAVQRLVSIDNGGFDVPLRVGGSEIVVALANDLHSPSGRHWGWGFEWRFDDVAGLALPPAR